MLRNRLLVPVVVMLMLAAFGVLTTSSQTVLGQAKKDDTKKVDPKKAVELRDDWPKVTGTLAKILAVDAKKRTAQVQFSDGKKGDLTLAANVVFMGPRGGKADIDDDRFVVGRTIKIVYDAGGKTVKEVHLQTIKASDKEKAKEKDKKDKK